MKDVDIIPIDAKKKNFLFDGCFPMIGLDSDIPLETYGSVYRNVYVCIKSIAVSATTELCKMVSDVVHLSKE